MSLKFVDIYNAVAEQAWSMYDADAETIEDFESGLKASNTEVYQHEMEFYQNQ